MAEFLPEKLVKEWSWRVDNGMPDYRNPLHLIELKNLLIQRRFPHQFVDGLLNNLNEQKFYARNPKGKQISVFTDKDNYEKAVKGGYEPIDKEEAEKDYQMASGISEDVELSDNILQLTRARLPWLLIGLVGGILGAKIIGIFDISENLDLALFIPLIAAMGGNVGVQSAAIIVQGIANNTITNHKILSKLLKELKVALLNGLICSIIIFTCTYLLNYQSDISITVSISLFSVIIFAALFGTFVPLSLKRYKIDPALATGPFITTVNDVLGLYIYFLIGQAILS